MIAIPTAGESFKKKEISDVGSVRSDGNIADELT